VQPDNSGSGKVHIAGDVRLRLHNAFGRAELVDLNWSNPLPLSQDLKLKASFPFLFSLPVGIEGDLSLFKKDSTFLELDRQVAFRYFLGGMNSIRLMLGRKTSNLISTARYRNATVLPPFADVSANNYGLGLMLMDLDYRLNPRRGYAVDVAGSAGIRIIDRNVALPEALYDSIDLRTTQYRLHCIADAYLPLGGRGVFNPGVSGAWMQADNIFSNELYRFGGLKSLRGFDEQSLGASAYLIGKAEFRFILEQNSYLLAFYNRAWYQDKSRVPEFEDSPYGFGVGITFDSKLGIFSFTYALGSQQGNPVEFRSAKVHFGVINYF
jgi:outer membrane protein assembly factor BamA